MTQPLHITNSDELIAVRKLSAINPNADAKGFYETNVDEFKAVIANTLEAGDSYVFVSFRESKHLFDSSMITQADVMATIFEDAETAHEFADTRHHSLVYRDQLQSQLIAKAIKLIASQYAVDEAQSYCADLESEAA